MVGVNDDSVARIRRSLERWTDFPVEERPRPLILNGPQVRFDGGFADGEDKQVFESGAIVADVDLAPGVLDLLRSVSSPSNPFNGTPLRIVEATAVRSRFASDRGRPRLAAWQLTVAGVDRPFIVRDPGVRHWWPADWDESMPRETWEEPSRIYPGGTRLTYAFGGTPWIYGRYVDAEVFETPHAVHVSPNLQWKEPRPRVMNLARAGGLRLDVELDSPLANRVLIASNGQPLTVLPS